MRTSSLSTVAIAAGVYALSRFSSSQPGRRNAGLAKGKRFLILGAGFAGVEAASELAKLLPEPDNGDIVLLDEHDYLLFTPMLTEAVGDKVEPHHIVVPLESFSDRITRVEGKIEKLDLREREVTLADREHRRIRADHIVLALGATSNFHHVPGAEQRAIPVKTIDDANRIRQSAQQLVKAAASETDPQERSAMLTFVVAGGGYTGVETIAALNEMIRDEAEKYTNLDPKAIRTVIAEPLDRIMSEVTPDLARYSKKELERAGVEVRLKTGIKSVEGDRIELTTGEIIRARTLIWSAGVEANSLVQSLGAPTGHNKGLKVRDTLDVPGFPGVWAVGDCAEIPEPGGKKFYGATAQNATREGKQVARNIVKSLKGEPLEPFVYTPIGELALVGRQRGVARIYGHNFSGLIAWALWRAVYIAKMPSMRQRLRVLGDWALDTTLGAPAEHRNVSTPTAPKQLAAGSAG